MNPRPKISRRASSTSLRWRLLKAAALILLLSPVTLADPVRTQITPAKVQAVFKLVNKTDPKREVADYHIEIRKVEPGALDLERGFHGEDKNKTDIKPSEVVDIGPVVLINLNFASNIESGASTTLSLEFVQKKNAIKIGESHWTVKDIFGKSVRVPKNEGGNVTVPGFEVVNDPQYIITNDFDTPMGIRGLQFLLNVPEMSLENLDPGLMPNFGAPFPDFVLDAHTALLFNVPGNLAPGNFLYAQGFIFDANFSVELGAFLHGHQEPIPEPTTLLLFGTGLAGVALKMCKRLKTRKRA